MEISRWRLFVSYPSVAADVESQDWDLRRRRQAAQQVVRQQAQPTHTLNELYKEIVYGTKYIYTVYRGPQYTVCLLVGIGTPPLPPAPRGEGMGKSQFGRQWNEFMNKVLKANMSANIQR
jgi:hypothetical protein